MARDAPYEIYHKFIVKREQRVRNYIYLSDYEKSKVEKKKFLGWRMSKFPLCKASQRGNFAVLRHLHDEGCPWFENQCICNWFEAWGVRLACCKWIQWQFYSMSCFHLCSWVMYLNKGVIYSLALDTKKIRRWELCMRPHIFSYHWVQHWGFTQIKTTFSVEIIYTLILNK